MSLFNVQGITAVVTGGGSGIGRAIAAVLLARGAGTVVVADINLDNATDVCTGLAAAGWAGLAVPIHIDVADGASIEAVVRQVEVECGPIDLWCSNAGIHTGAGLGDARDWERSIAVNLMGHVHAARFVIPGMKQRGRGHFLVTASAAGLLSDFRAAPYTASKHAAVALAEWLAITCMGDGISVHCLCPEGVKTAMTRESSEKSGKGMTFLEPEDVAAFTLDCMSDGDFLILPHPRVAEFELRRATDRQRWIESMHRASLSMQPQLATPS